MVLLAQLWAHGVMVAYTHRVTLPLTLTHRDNLGSPQTKTQTKKFILKKSQKLHSWCDTGFDFDTDI